MVTICSLRPYENQACVEWAWEHRKEWDIAPEYFLQLSRSKINFEKPSNRIVIPTGLLLKAYGEIPTDRKSILKWSFLPNNILERRIRRTIPRNILNENFNGI